jgi:cytochrome c3-like protein
MKLRAGAVLLLLTLAPLSGATKNSCQECHAALDGSLQKPALLFKDDVHLQHGLGCSDCHGGNPEADDPTAAMSRGRGFSGKIARTAVPKLCARCHADANLMHKYNPRQRVDQYAQYQTSVHGKRIAAGDTAAATCIDCHSVHDIREVKNALSPVHPLRLPSTCARCHADKAHMAKYGIPTNQYDEYRQSVHWQALEQRGDLSAPSCASCHGNHGATPPGVNSVAAVCGTCHVMMENLYEKSPHQAAFTRMKMAGCVVCHNNHAVLKPTVKMLAGSASVCAECHEPSSAGGLAAAAMAQSINSLTVALSRSDDILTRAAGSGMEVSEAQLQQQEAKESLLKALVAVHAFDAAAVKTPVAEGLKISAETYLAGQNALKERDRRRKGLGLSLLTIVVTMAGLWLAIRRLEKPPRAEG